MPGRVKVLESVHIVAGPDLTDPRDCLAYVVRSGGELVLIDSGAGTSALEILRGIKEAAPGATLRALILTHGHIDHIGGAAETKERSGCEIVAHELDADAIEGRNPAKSAESWYGLKLRPVMVDDLVRRREETRALGGLELHIMHAPGHTPGSIVVHADIDGKRVLFGQDIHGPFDPDFGSDVAEWRRSMSSLLSLDADVLCEGHFGVFEGRDAVRRFIEGWLESI